MLYTAPAKYLLVPGAHHASHNSCVGKVSRGCTQCADPVSQRRWHLLCLLETSQLAGVCWVGGLLALPPPTKGQPAMWLSDRSLLLWKGIFKDQLSLTVSLCHSLWQLSGFRPELTQLRCVLASCCIWLTWGFAAFRAAVLGARSWNNLRELQYC